MAAPGYCVRLTHKLDNVLGVSQAKIGATQVVFDKPEFLLSLFQEHVLRQLETLRLPSILQREILSAIEEIEDSENCSKPSASFVPDSFRTEVRTPDSLMTKMKRVCISNSGVARFCEWEQDMAALVMNVIVDRDASESKLNTIHLLEMEQYSAKGGGRLVEVVNKHVAELEVTGRHWDERVSDVKHGQLANLESVTADLLPEPSEIDYKQALVSDSLASKVVWFGGLRNAFELSFQTHNIESLCRISSIQDPQRVNTLSGLFTDNLSALLLPHPSPNLGSMGSSGTSPRVNAFVRCCYESTEFLFPSFEQQVENTKGLLKDNESGLGFGDMFITKHSNLRSVHAAFHLICGSAKLHCQSEDVVMRGLDRILKVTCEYGFKTLYIPLSFTEARLYSSREPSPALMSHIHSVFSQVKNSLVTMVQSDVKNLNLLQRIIFLIPPVEPVHNVLPLLTRSLTVMEEVFQGSY